MPVLCRTGKILHKQGWVTAMQRSPGQQLRAARFQTEAPKIFPTMVVRLKVDNRFVNEQKWTAIVQRPAKVAKEWCHRHLSFEIMKCVHDFWGWAERSFKGGGKLIMAGLMRIDVAAIECSWQSLEEIGGLWSHSHGWRSTQERVGNPERVKWIVATKLELTLVEMQVGVRQESLKDQ